MNDVENKIEKTFGKENPFSVPDGYFDNFTERLMAKLPEESNVVSMDTSRTSKTSPTTSTRRKWIGWVSAVAAIFVGAVFYMEFTQKTTGNSDTNMVNTTGVYANTAQSYDEYEEVMDYTLNDNSDVYAYLSGY